MNNEPQAPMIGMKRRDVLRGLANGMAVPLVGGLLPAEMWAWGRDVHLAASAAQPVAESLTEPLMRTLTVV